MCVVAAVSQSVGSPAGHLMSPHTRGQVLEPAAVDEVTCSDVVTYHNITSTSRQDEHLKIHVSEVSRQVFKVMEAVLLLSQIKKILKFNIISHSPKKIGAFLVVLRQK